MPLTSDEQHLVYEVLGIPDSTSILYLDTQYATGKTSMTGAILQSKTAIDAILAALTDPLVARLQALLAQWLTVATTGVKLAPNTANEGVDRNPARERRLIRTAVRKIVPVVIQGVDTPGGDGIPLG